MEKSIKVHVKDVLQKLYNVDPDDLNIEIEKTREGFEGDFTLVVFPFLKYSKKTPEQTAKEIGAYLRSKMPEIASYNVIKGFLNLVMTQEYWIDELNYLIYTDFSFFKNSGKNIMIEFSSPNTNKPLHLGHIRNNLLGDSISRLIAETGNNVIKVNLINDRGIHICKSMLAWQKWKKDLNPENTGKKGDKLVGDFYVLFENEYKKQIQELIDQGLTKEEAENAPLMQEAREMLRKWESNDPEIMKIWEIMNSWVYAGFAKTYSDLGITFDKVYYESQTYLLGKEIVEKGLEKGIFYREADNSVWIDLSNEGLDKKLLLRSDGTTVYMTQDLGTAVQRFQEFNPDLIIYVVGNEQEYHFKVLKKILEKLYPEYADRIFHLSYGMVELPEGKMKSREGKVVDADDLIEEMIQTATEIANENGKVNNLPEKEKSRILKIIALGALKYYILKVDPKKQIVFNPAESIDFAGNTGPFIQYTHARICSILRKADEMKIKFKGKINSETEIVTKEINLISLLSEYESVLVKAAKNFDPGSIANYVYNLAKEFNQYYHDYTILKEQDPKVLQLRLMLCKQIAATIQKSMNLLGIEVPEVM
ncbi:MAG: arginine--tRNA ligase [Bacteroidales bacterium]|jgi:arginyl-tRNA synthetase|nr:arginine--tRNA ligase [Bacteroidales bacterium]HOL98015.1 arginine--tRNA ligase [Bacteroidales bacterium]HOM36556.1 arginine--tRNA ligase [Bacteroidales bacterium]HPD23703.1 arginine--tRNA ligase [Bacteroidales bacterium]HRS99818.1 arginine--tRNA ligase [Bacteroidales bacterium]